MNAFFVNLLDLIKWIGRYIIRDHKAGKFPNRNTIDRPVAILGNGSSLKEALTFLQSLNYDFCVVNFSANSEFFFKLKPHFYVMVDPTFFVPTPRHKNNVKNLEDNISKVDWDMFIFVPNSYIKIAQERYKNGNDHIYIYGFSQNHFSENFSLTKLKYMLYTINLAGPIITNVGVASLFCMINSGFKEIHLYGMEHSWIKLIHVDKNNFVCMKDTHYYDNKEVEPIKLYYQNRPERLHEQLRFQAAAFAAYWDIKGYTDYLGSVKIINNTPESFIDAFDKMYK